MLYLTGSLPAKPHLLDDLKAAGVGLLITPRNDYPTKPTADMRVAADNGCFQQRWDADEWVAWVRGVRSDVLFCTVPDVVADWQATRHMWDRWRGVVPCRPAYVLQDDQPAADVPWDELDAVFVGGSTRYKLSEAAHRLVVEAKERGKWVHMGRVNSYRRCLTAAQWGCDSVDGTFLAFGPDINVPRLLRWVRRLDRDQRQPTLF